MRTKKHLGRTSLIFIVAILMLTMFPFNAIAGNTGILNKNQSIAMGTNHFLTVKVDGSLWGWGSNYHGELGNGTTKESEIPIKIMDDVVAVAAGYNHSLILLKDSTLWVCGRNDDGQLGIDTGGEDSPTPVKIMDDVVSIAAGGDHSLAVKRDGTLWSWGDNFGGQIGDGTQLENRTTPVKVLDEVAAVAASEYMSMAIKADGSLWVWGKTHLSDEAYGSNPLLTDVELTPFMIMEDVKSVAAGGMHCLAVKRDGSLWAWGNNTYGQLCDGDGWQPNESGTDYETIWKATPFKVMDGVKSVAAGGFYSLVQKTDDSLWAWGETYSEWRGKEVNILDDVAAVATTEYRSAAVRNDGRLWVWGSGNLGDGEYRYDYIDTPIRIMEDVRLYGKYLGEPAPGSRYIYDTPNSTSFLAETQANITTVVDRQTAIDTFDTLLTVITDEQKENGETLDELALLWEETLTAGTKKNVLGSTVIIDVDGIKDMVTSSEPILKQFNESISTQNIELLRDPRVNLQLTSNVNSEITITAESGLSELEFDNVEVAVPFAAVSLRKDTISGGEEIALRNLAITVVQPGFNVLRLWGIAVLAVLAVLFMIPSVRMKLPKWLLPTVGCVVILANVSTYILIVPQPYEQETGEEGVEVILNGTEQVALSLPVKTGTDPEFLVICDDEGNPSGKYNVLTNTIDTKINESGIYVVKDNRISFSDIETKSALMQEAIEQLASRGIMPGLRDDYFSPDDLITRAEYVSVILRTLSLIDPDIESTFEDVKKNDWFYSVAASASKQNIISGFPDNTFRGNIELPKDQMIVVTANTLIERMKYKVPKNVDEILLRYSDAEDLATWSWEGIALATKSGIMIYREDAKFAPVDAMTRGDAAIMLYRMFMKIW